MITENSIVLEEMSKLVFDSRKLLGSMNDVVVRYYGSEEEMLAVQSRLLQLHTAPILFMRLTPAEQTEYDKLEQRYLAFRREYEVYRDKFVAKTFRLQILSKGLLP